ncbi:MAG: DNA gyrase inhibitor YacG [Nitrospirota bacterium]|nr:DNA gyrase inhibitor YacG [Nitrospirota bacterium]
MNTMCPICRRESEWKGNPFRPFCSERCQLVDLGAWASGQYQVPEDQATSSSIPTEDGSQ